MSVAFLRALGMIALLLAPAVPMALAQDPPVRVRGTIDRVEGDTYVVKARGGGELKVTLAEKAMVVALIKASLADIKQGSYVGVAGMPQADGSQKALEVHIFPEAMRGTGDGHRGWDLQPSSTMTNGNVEQTAASSDGQVLTLKYKDGEKKIIVPAGRADRRLRAGREERAQARCQHLHCRRDQTARRHAAGAARERRARRRAADVKGAGDAPSLLSGCRVGRSSYRLHGHRCGRPRRSLVPSKRPWHATDARVPLRYVGYIRGDGAMKPTRSGARVLACALLGLLFLAGPVPAQQQSAVTIEKLVTDGWEVAGYIAAWENRSLILFKHKEHKHLVQCSVLIDVLRNPRVVTYCYELR